MHYSISIFVLSSETGGWEKHDTRTCANHEEGDFLTIKGGSISILLKRVKIVVRAVDRVVC